MPPQPPADPADAAFRRLESLHPKSIDLSLERLAALLRRLDNPQTRLPPTFHIAGTNGKGSTLAFMDACLRAAGHLPHAYTSPHLVSATERIRLRGQDISEDRLLALLHRCESVNAGAPITLFEIITAAAFLAFSETPADALLLEVGLGGRLDATNLVSRPEVAVITPVGLDHQSFLGDDIAAIAGEKAGILKPDAPAVVSRQTPDALRVIETRACALGVDLWRQDCEWHVTRRDDALHYADPLGALTLPLPALVGPHQVDNAGTALAALRHSRFASALTPEHLAHGIASAQWPARLQLLSMKKPGGVGGIAPHKELWLDGGHNPSAARALANAMAEMNARAPKPLHLVVGMMRGKDALGFFAPFRALSPSVSTLAIPEEENAMPAEELARHAQSCGLPARPCASLADAIQDGGDARILICGSLYLAGQILKSAPPQK